MAIINKMFTKDPNSVLDYKVDWSNYLGTDEISSVAWVLDSGITQDSASNTTTVATIVISGGTAGSSYDVTCRITTSGGITADRTFRLKVQQR